MNVGAPMTCTTLPTLSRVTTVHASVLRLLHAVRVRPVALSTLLNKRSGQGRIQDFEMGGSYQVPENFW